MGGGGWGGGERERGSELGRQRERNESGHDFTGMKVTWLTNRILTEDIVFGKLLVCVSCVDIYSFTIHTFHLFQGCQRNTEDWQRILQVQLPYSHSTYHHSPYLHSTYHHSPYLHSLILPPGSIPPFPHSLIPYPHTSIPHTPGAVDSVESAGGDPVVGQVCQYLPEVGEDVSLREDSEINPQP